MLIKTRYLGNLNYLLILINFNYFINLPIIAYISKCKINNLVVPLNFINSIYVFLSDIDKDPGFQCLFMKLT